MHLLYLHQYFCPPGGSGNNRSFDLARHWVAKGHQVTMVTSTAYFPESLKHEFASQSFPLQWETNGIKVILVDVPYSHLMPFRKRVKAFWAFYRKAFRATRELKGIDLIYASSTPLTVGELGRKLSRRWKKPYVYEVVDVWPDVPIGMGIITNPLVKAWLNKKTNRIYRESIGIVALSEGMRDQVLSHQVAPEKVVVIHNGTDLNAFPYSERKAGTRIKVVYTGTVGIANGLSQLADTAQLIQQKGRKDIEFIILGGGNDLEKVKSRAAALSLENLTFLKRIAKEEVAGFLADADIGLVCFAPHPVLEANSANKFYDYLSSGLPVIINYQGWQAEYLSKWECGLSSKQGDNQAFAANIIRLADDPEFRNRMGKMGRKLAETKFSREELSEKLMDYFAILLKRS